MDLLLARTFANFAVVGMFMDLALLRTVVTLSPGSNIRESSPGSNIFGRSFGSDISQLIIALKI